MTVVTLTAGEMYMAAHMGAMRRISNILERRRKLNHGLEADDWNLDLKGCMAEVAVARHLNMFWSGTLDDFNAMDVGGCVEVRSIWKRRSDCMLLHDTDRHKEAPVVLVWVDPPNFTLLGWAPWWEGGLDKYWRNTSRPCYFVPQEVLYDIAGLLPWLKDKGDI